jgi:hypothetical protein
MNLVAQLEDPHHPQAGGAELHLFEILRRAARDGPRRVASEAFVEAPRGDSSRDPVFLQGTWYNAHFALAALFLRRFRGAI